MKPVRHDDLKARPLGHSLGDFLLFCEMQPADSSYDYNDPNNCACGQYDVAIQGSWWDTKALEHEDDFWTMANSLACGDSDNLFGRRADWTFARLAARVRAHLAE